MKFLFQIINGLHIGSIYALVALGYSMVYGIVKLINFAHGDIIMVGAYAAYVLLVLCGLPVWVAVIGSIVFCALAGVLIERIAYRRLLVKEAPRISLLITAIGVSIFLQNLFQLIFTSSGKSFPSIFNYEPIVMGERQVSIVSLITIVTTVVLMVLLQLLVKKTRLGKAMRAVSEDAGAAKLMGINTNSTVSWTFAIGSGLAAVGAVLYSASYPLIDPYMGSMLGLKAFVAAVLGGIGSIPGAMIGGIAIGLCECFVSAIGLSAWKDAVTFAILIIVLLFKPTGFLGRKVQEKV